MTDGHRDRILRYSYASRGKNSPLLVSVEMTVNLDSHSGISRSRRRQVDELSGRGALDAAAGRRVT